MCGRELTRTDPLTKIPNRRYFMECLDTEFERLSAMDGL